MHPSRWSERPKEVLGRIVVVEGRTKVLSGGGMRGRRTREGGERRAGGMEVDLIVKELAEVVEFGVEREPGVRTLDPYLSILWMVWREVAKAAAGRVGEEEQQRGSPFLEGRLLEEIRGVLGRSGLGRFSQEGPEPLRTRWEGAEEKNPSIRYRRRRRRESEGGRMGDRKSVV